MGAKYFEELGPRFSASGSEYIQFVIPWNIQSTRGGDGWQPGLLAMFPAPTTRNKINLKWNSILEERMIEKCMIL